MRVQRAHARDIMHATTREMSDIYTVSSLGTGGLQRRVKQTPRYSDMLLVQTGIIFTPFSATI